MCTLTYRLTESGYELFFNRDEQRSRAQAIVPQVDNDLNAIYPVDPVGQGTWLGVHQSGLCLALLNYYQAEKKATSGEFISRGEIILTLLTSQGDIIERLKDLPLSHYQPFQLCIFPEGLNITNKQLLLLQWDGENLTKQPHSPFFTSSGVDYPQVYQARKKAFEQIVSASAPTTEQLLKFHQQQQNEGKLSVKMFREDAQTVSFSHIVVGDAIQFNYIDYIDGTRSLASLKRI
ncbi:hypothetical protein GCM10007916_20090 [Psychromonas marina]|uniref:NRDE family protein n=1 Tax=Psychromonas marina TaxID=88364 RepID=A0ABQ6E0S3_9GAMM|nr:NRDE family protein [Psychromonas marina]GLS90942.1 hypothetical protein GCM10007916_20090 [Psychromonas marina]